jgi:hypothetical protein
MKIDIWKCPNDHQKKENRFSILRFELINKIISSQRLSQKFSKGGARQQRKSLNL